MTGYIGLGSNQGDRLGNLRAARDGFARRGVTVLAASSVYETEPIGEVTEQSDFLNACLKVRTELSAEDLLEECKAIERDLGRRPGGPRHGPRPIDVDLLLLDELEYRSERLTLPHPEMLTRRFVLEPLLEVEPDMTLPGGAAGPEALEALRAQRVVRRAPL